MKLSPVNYPIIKNHSTNFKNAHQIVFKGENSDTFKKTEKANKAPLLKPNEILEALKLKKEIRKMYDLIYEDMKNSLADSGINFVKPKLNFKKLKHARSQLNRGKNSITINSECLYPNTLARLNSTEYCIFQTLEDGKDNAVGVVGYKRGEKLEEHDIYLTFNEKLLYFGYALAHELTHAYQEQMMLCGEGAIDEYIARLKVKNSFFEALDREALFIARPFWKMYQPEKTFPLNEEFFYNVEDKEGKTLEILYTIDEMIDAQVEYNTNNTAQYRANLMEIEARMSGIEYYANYKKYLPDLDVDEDVVEWLRKVTEQNCYQYLTDEE